MILKKRKEGDKRKIPSVTHPEIQKTTYHRRKKLRRAIPILAMIASVALLTCSVMGTSSPSLALDNSSVYSFRPIENSSVYSFRRLDSSADGSFLRNPDVPEFKPIDPVLESDGYDEALLPPETKDFEEVFAKTFEPQDAVLYVNNKLYSKRILLEGDVLYVGISDFVYVLDNTAKISKSASKVSVSTDEVSLTAGEGASYIVANGRYLWCNGGVRSEDGTLMIPLSLICTVFGISRSSDGERISATSGGAPIESGDTFYNKDTVYWLSRIISAESRGEPFRGKIAVGNVVLNRVRSKDFPNTVYGVIFDRKNGVQFSPVEIGSVYNTPDADSVIAAKLCLEGVTVSNKILYFLNPDTAGNFWITENRNFVTAIGSHKFYS